MPEITTSTIQELLPSIIAVAGILVVMWVGLWLSKRAIRRLADRMEDGDREHLEEIERWASQLIKFIRRAIELVAGVAAIFIVLRGLGISGLPHLTWEQVAAWLAGPGLRILLVLGGAYVLTRIVHLLISQLPLFIARQPATVAEAGERKKRANTISHLLSGITTTVIMSVALLIVLDEMGVDIRPILTGAGIMGLAVGFGAQNLVRDFIAGFFLIIENQVRVGDIAIINGKGGLVEAIRLRTIVLRSFDGTVHVIPNGAITDLANMTKDFSYAVLDVGVAYKENVDHVMDVLREIGEEFGKDPAFSEKLLGPLEVFGVDKLDDSAVIIRSRIKTLPIQQWGVARELRRRVKNTFDAKGIEIPFPHITIYTGEASKAFPVELAEKLRGQSGGGNQS